MSSAALFGPTVGRAAPRLDLPDLSGTVRPLESLMGLHGLVLQFTRPAWCAASRRTNSQLREAADLYQELGLGTALVTTDDPPQAAAYAAELGLTCPVLVDAGRVAIRRFRLLNPDEGIAVPCLVLVDRSGTVRLTRQGHPAPVQLVEAVLDIAKQLR